LFFFLLIELCEILVVNIVIRRYRKNELNG